MAKLSGNEYRHKGVTIQNLLTVKSIVTILLTVVFSYLAMVGRISGEQFLTIFSVVIAFYFGSQHQKGMQFQSKEGDSNE